MEQEEERAALQEKIASIEEKIAALEETIAALEEKVAAIDKQLEITLENPVGNASAPHYQQLIEEKRVLLQILLQEKSLLLQLQTVEQGELSAQAAKRRKVQSYDPVSLGSTTPSTFSTSPEKTKCSKREIVPLYRHWFAIELYKYFCTETNTVNQYTPSVPQRSLNHFVAMIGVITNPTSTTTGYMSQGLSACEVFTTAQLARELDRFLFDDHTKLEGTCYHQMCSRLQTATPERPDLMVFSMAQQGTLVMPVVVGDFKKKGDFAAAKDQTIAYAISSLEKCTRRCTVVLGLPLTSVEMGLFVCVGHRKMMAMEVCKVQVENTEDLKRFCCTVFCAVHSLVRHPIETRYSNALTVTPDGEGQDVAELSARAVRCNGMVQKYYDTKREPWCVPNLELIQSLGEYGLSSPSVHMLSGDGRLQRLDYKYVEGSHSPHNAAQVAQIILGLDKIHKQQFVHSDIRKQNLVFASDEAHAYIIDFDLAASVDTEYPACYNTTISERHTTASPSRPRQQQHDRYSLHHVLMNSSWCQQTATQTQKEVLNTLNDQQQALEDIARELLLQL